MPEIIGTLVGLAFVALLFGWMWADDNSWFGWFDRMSIGDDRLAMRALTQHSKLMSGEKGAEYGNYQPVDLDSDDVLKFATVTLPDVLNCESHWAWEILKRNRVVSTLLGHAEESKVRAEEALSSSSRRRMDRHHNSMALHALFVSDARQVELHGHKALLAELREKHAAMVQTIGISPRLCGDHHFYDELARLACRIDAIEAAAR
ncbi:hypothetical protein I3U41_16865 [Mycobacteroides abscessus subsp. abscessus]|uniref:hypothetical protein n=1 Tax=Mycobacteroides abscessus TaxID=36809 RepID=UPI0019CFE375|nr:hypothetical protein [Mycobacteroides abscessus]QSN19599.1 hypothetical protein I3U41_16865 [Mycobacteroides abscessus subsp. abscessus]